LLACYENRKQFMPVEIAGTLEKSTLTITGLFTNLQLVPGVGLAILDGHLRFRTVNPTLARMNGISVAGHLGKTISAVLGSFEHAVSPLIRQVLTNQQPLLHCNLVGLLPTRREEGHWIAHYLPLNDSLVGAVVLEVTTQHKVESLLASLTSTQAPEVDRTLEAVERDYMVHILRKVKGQVSGSGGAAIRLGMKRTTLQSRLLKLGINPQDYKSAS
jgi:DNA-binding protein Fis